MMTADCIIQVARLLKANGATVDDSSTYAELWYVCCMCDVQPMHP